MKKQIRMLTDIGALLAVTLVLAVTLLPVGLTEAEELKSAVTEEAENTADRSGAVSDPPVSEPSRTSDTVGTPQATTEKTTAQTTAEETQAPATTPSVTTTAAPTTQPPETTWTEQEVSGVKYVNTDGISSVGVAIIGSAKIRPYELNEQVTVVALTDTDYYKLEDGTYIHADFLSDTETVTTSDDEDEDEDEADTDTQTDPTDETVSDTEEEPDTTPETDDEAEDDVVPLSAQTGGQSRALEMFDMVNEYRAQYGLPAFLWDYNAYPAAQIRANELLQRNSHTRPDGTGFATVYNDIGYRPSASGENIVYYYGDPRPALDTLINSPSHRELILSTEYTHIAIAYTYSEVSYWGYYWVQEFTTP